MVTNKVGRINLSVVPGRAEPSDKAELTTELLFGEKYEVLEEQGKWILIKCLHDSYECWIDKKQHSIDEGNFSGSIRTPYLYNIARSESGVEYVLAFASEIPNTWQCSSLLPLENQNQTGSRADKISQLARQYLGTPYRWGGRTPLGIDCSGFVQNVFLALGESLPRDAHQQAELGTTVSFVEEAQTGDLAFFDNAEGKITHVGIVLKSDAAISIIHASGMVRIDALDHEGIFLTDNNSYSHKLRLIKRLS